MGPDWLESRAMAHLKEFLQMKTFCQWKFYLGFPISRHPDQRSAGNHSWMPQLDTLAGNGHKDRRTGKNKAKWANRRAGWIVKRLRDGRTDQPTNQRTDITGYRGALTHLKSWCLYGHDFTRLFVSYFCCTTFFFFSISASVLFFPFSRNLLSFFLVEA